MPTINKEYLNSRLSFLMQSSEERQQRQQNLNQANNKKLLALKDIYKGERCFIIGSSPSIKNLDLTKLNNEFTFTVNRGYKLIDNGLTNATYHIMSDVYTLKDDNVRDEIPQKFAQQFLIYGGIDFPFSKNVTFFDYTNNPNNLKQKIKPNITDPFISCSTIIAYALQFAYFMGFSEINIIGVDLDFSAIMGHSYEETDGEKQRQQDASIKQAKFMLEGIDNISQQLIAKGITVQNASPVGILNSIPRVNYNNLFKGNNNE